MMTIEVVIPGLSSYVDNKQRTFRVGHNTSGNASGFGRKTLDIRLSPLNIIPILCLILTDNGRGTAA